jgi:hypothetical protein
MNGMLEYRFGDLRSHEPTVRCPITRARLMVRARHLPPGLGATSARPGTGGV